MRRTAAALATLVLAALAVVGPLAPVGQAAPGPTIHCGASATSPECALLDQLAGQLAPLAPVLALGGPVISELTTATLGLAARADQPGGVPAAQVAAQAQALLDALAVLPQPVRSLLAAAQLDGLASTLEALIAETTAVPAAALAPQAAAPAPPTPAAVASVPAPAPAVSPGLPSSGDSLSAVGSGEATRSTPSPAIPDVPVGDPLTLAPLALPDFGFSPTVGLAPAADLASPAAASGAADGVQLAAEAAARRLPSRGDGPEVVVVVALSVLLLGAAFATQSRQNRHTIPD
ncbi:MAG TPA: hypothetical protein VGP53_02765 [Acidimicrobiales bacterium]|nr:hypothetical protein [Acidimicrobiales bacterium]